MTTSTSPQAITTAPESASSSSSGQVAQRIHDAAESLDDLAAELSAAGEHSARWDHLRSFLGEVKTCASSSESTPEELTGWAVSVTFAAVETRIRSLDPEAFFLIRSLGEACLLGARFLEEQQDGHDSDVTLGEFNAAIDFVVDGVSEIEIPQVSIWKQAA